MSAFRSLVTMAGALALLGGVSVTRADPAPAPRPAPGKPDDAQAHIDRATLAFKTNNLVDALAELRAAYAIDPRPDLLYAIGQIYSNLHQCRDAIEYYQRFLATKPGADPASAAIEAIDACNAAEAKPVPVEPAKPPPKPATPPPAHAAERAWYGDTIADLLIGGGAIAGVVAVVEYHAATSDRDSADAMHSTYGAYASLIDSAHSERTFAVVAGIVGAGLVGGGLVHFLLTSGEQTVMVAPTPEGAVVTWAGRF